MPIKREDRERAAALAAEKAREEKLNKWRQGQVTEFAIKLLRQRYTPKRAERALRFICGRFYGQFVDHAIAEAIEVTGLFRGRLYSVDRDDRSK